MSTQLPIRHMTLYKHGVGFFQREGEIEGQEVKLSFRRTEINDVLKSLTAFDRGQGQVLGVHYETPEDKEARLAECSINLSDDRSLLDLLRDLRGRQVRLSLRAKDSAGEEVVGRMVGVDVDPEHPLLRSLVALLDEERDTVTAWPLRQLCQVTVLDSRAAHDVGFFLDTSMSEEVRRTVRVRLTPGAHDLLLQYIAPSPTWRVSYRVVAESGGEGEEGELLLLGWGLFDNRLDEDLDQVSVTLVAGQPISFIYDLYTSRIPERPVVEDEARVAAAPVEFEGAALGAGMARQMAEEAPRAKLMRAAAPPAMAAERLSLKDVAESVAVETEGADLGELFQYVVTAPVSVKRGESAMVPIISSRLSYHKEHLYNRAKMPNHPVVSARFDNETGLTLERGPVTVVEDGEYHGEAIVPFTKAGGEVYLPYAVELGVKVTERDSSRTEMAGLSIQKAYLLIEEYHVRKTTYTLENSTGRPLTVTIERPVTTNYDLFDTRQPDVETAQHRRWRVPVAESAGKAKFTVQERQLRRRREKIMDQRYKHLRRYLKGSWLDESAYRKLENLLELRDQNARDEKQIEKLQTEQERIIKRQDQLRKNLSALAKDDGEEGRMRSGLLRKLQDSEERFGRIERSIKELRDAIARREAQIETELEQLG